MENKGIKYVIYALLLMITVATVVMIIDNFYPFLPINPISGPSSAARAGKTFWRDGGENLVVTTDDSPTVLADNYMMSIQLMIGDSRVLSDANSGRFRHIVHRGSSPVQLPATKTSGPAGPSGIKLSDVPDADAQYKATGLPSLMNPGLFLDQFKNDLHVFVHTTTSIDASGNPGSALLLESITIEDLPLTQAITIGIACSGQTLEVYVNCHLFSTLILKGLPYLPPADNQWLGRYGVWPISGLVKNLQLWPSALGPTDYKMLCSIASFNKNDLPESCPTAPG